jgi:hypothetical protein
MQALLKVMIPAHMIFLLYLIDAAEKRNSQVTGYLNNCWEEQKKRDTQYMQKMYFSAWIKSNDQTL